MPIINHATDAATAVNPFGAMARKLNHMDHMNHERVMLEKAFNTNLFYKKPEMKTTHVDDDTFLNPPLTDKLKSKIKESALAYFDERRKFSPEFIQGLEIDAAHEVYEQLFKPIVDHLLELGPEFNGVFTHQAGSIRVEDEDGDTVCLSLGKDMVVPDNIMPRHYRVGGKEEFPVFHSYLIAQEEMLKESEVRRRLNANLIEMLDGAKDVKTLKQRWPQGMMFYTSLKDEISETLKGGFEPKVSEYD